MCKILLPEKLTTKPSNHEADAISNINLLVLQMKQRLRVSHVAHHYAHRNCPHVSGETRPGWIPKSQMTHILEDLIHKMEGQPSKKQVIWVLSIK